MPNWCATYISINGTKEQLDALNNAIDKATESNPLNADFGNSWLGNLLLYLGIDKDEVIYGDIRCRGYISYSEMVLDDDTSQLIINTETAWVPMLKPFLMMMEKYAPDAELIYTAEEPGTIVYCTNDPAEYDYIIDFDSTCFDQIPDGFDIGCNYMNEQTLRQSIIELTDGKEEDSTEELIQIFKKKYQHLSLFVNHYDFVEADKWN